MTFMGFVKNFSGMMAARWYVMLTSAIMYLILIIWQVLGACRSCTTPVYIAPFAGSNTDLPFFPV